MIYLRRLSHLFKDQHLTLAGSSDGQKSIGMTDRRLTLIERCGPEDEVKELKYIESFAQGSIDPMDIQDALDSEGLLVLPEGAETVPPGEGIDGGPGGKLVPPLKVYDLISQTIAGTYTFALPAGVEACTDEWLAFRFNSGKLYIRSANDYGDLLKSTEVVFDVTYSDEIEDDTCFAVKTELIRVCRELAGDKVVISVKRTKSTYIGIRTPDLTCVFFCPPLVLEENLKVSKDKEESPDTPENQETDTDVVPEVEEAACVEDVVPEAEPAEEPETEDSGTTEEEFITGEDATADEAAAAIEAEEGGEVDDPESVEKPATEDVDPLEAYDTLIPDILKAIQETVKAQGNEAKRLLKNATKQSRKTLKSKADPEEVAKLKAEVSTLTKKLSIVEHQRDAAKKALKDIL